MKNLVLSLILSCFYSLIFAQSHELVFESVEPEGGFAAPLIRCTFQDKAGFLWFGTLHGIYRFDGFNLKPYGFDPKKLYTKGYINSIYQDSDGSFLLASTEGLIKLNKRKEDFKRFIPDSVTHLGQIYILSVFRDSNGILWVGSMKGLSHLDETIGKLYPVKFPEGMEYLNDISFQSIAEDKNRDLWFGTSIGLIKFDRRTKNFIPAFIDPEQEKLKNKLLNSGDFSIPVIFDDNSGYLWIGTYGGRLLKLNPETSEIIEYPIIESGSKIPCPIQSITVENEHQFWIGTFRGLILFEKSSGQILTHYTLEKNYTDGLTDEKITSVLKEKSGTLWIATINGGLNRVNRTIFQFKKIHNESWITDQTARLVPYKDFCVGRSGSLFIGTSSGVEEIRPGINTVIKHAPYEDISVLMQDSKGNLWIGVKQASGGGFFKKTASGKLYNITDRTGKPIKNEVHCIFESSEGRIFFGFEPNLFEVDTSQNTCSIICTVDSKIFSLGEDYDKNLLLGTLLGGLFVFDPQSNKIIKRIMKDENDPASLIDNTILDIYKDKKNRIWLSSSLGFCRYGADGKFKGYNENDGLLKNAVFCITEDDAGKLWLGNTGGITYFDPETEIFRNYDESYGTFKGYHYAYGKSRGIIYFRSKNGVTYFDPLVIKENRFIPPVKITEFNVFDKSYYIDNNISLKYDQNYISFEFAALSFISTERNLYKYSLEGLDKSWVNSGTRRYAAYTDLEPGKYIFRVKASNNDGVWNNKGTSLSITILPPWWKTYWAYAGYFLFIGVLIFSWRKYDLKRQDLKYQLKLEHAYAEEQEKISKMKSRFFTNISHEFRTPLTLIVGPAEKILKNNTPQDNLKQAGLIRKNALRLLGLINQLLDISRLDEGKLKLRIAKHNIVSFTRGLLMNFESYAESRDISLKVKSNSEMIEVYYDREKMERILLNILSNAFKFTAEGGRITIDICETYTNKVIIKISDTGIGISESELPKLFDRFYQADGSHTRPYEGAGIGLALTKELVEMHKGTISIISKEGEGTEVTVEVLLGRDHFEKNDLQEDTDIENMDENYNITREYYDGYLTGNSIDQSDAQLVKTEKEKLIVLIVEDNSDVREYICDTIGDEFRIEEAANGDQGIRKAKALVPDMIICDIMMPGMDGYEMTRILKNDIVTNHIPIIQLTAKSDRASKLEGLTTGADDYIIKPFDIEELKLRINNLIKIRRTLQEKYASGDKIQIKNGEQKLSEANENFMCRVMEVIAKHIAEEEFNIEDFGKEVGLSRAQLHRKIKALTGKSASRYIRSYRLSAAKRMIEEEKGNISEIAYSVGFSSPIYFSKCFKDEFGYPPSELKFN